MVTRRGISPAGSAIESESHCNLRIAKSQLKHFRVEMAASSVAGPATSFPLSPNSDSPASSSSPQPPQPPPPTTSSQKPPSLQETYSDVEQEQLLSPSKSQRAPDFLPPQILQALKQQQQQQRKRETTTQPTSPRRLQQSPKKENEVCFQCGLPPVRPPAKLWSYPRQRSKFTHLTAHPPCVCGAGNSDISFLYDVPEGKQQKELPPSLIPNEYHIHKKVGVVGLEFREDQYTTQSLAHDSHVTVFPSMNPGSRYEVLALKSTMDMMLKKAGLPHQDSELSGPTQVHNLLDLVKQEQLIYSICFHEVIRQVSVQCAERGELLQEIRSRYTRLLDCIPRQVMSLHEDMLSQRALCRRISAEFRHFRSKIASITDRLGKLKDIDTEVVRDTLTAHRDLSSALTESEKNANLLQEYHGLYELQRKRLQESVDKLRQERDVWEGAAYSLAQQVTEQDSQQLRTLRRLQLGERMWTELAHHFTTLLGQADIQQLREIDECVRRWREGVMSESGRLEEVESALSDRLLAVEKTMKKWCVELRNIVGADGRVVPLSQERLQQLSEEVEVWLSVLNSESEQFSGETQLTRTEGLHSLNTLVERWTEVGLEIFSRHQEMNRYDHAPSDHAHSPEHQTLLSLGADVGVAMRHCTARASGDNGVAVGFIRLITPLETWHSRLSQCVSGKNKLPDSDLLKLRSLLEEWLEQLQRIRCFIGAVTDEQGHPLKCTPMDELSVAVEKWRSALSHAVTNRHTKIASMVTDLHSSLVLWMVRLLLTSTHTTWALSRWWVGGGEERQGEGVEREEEEEMKLELESEGGSWDQGMGLTQLLSVDLEEEYKNLSSSIKRFTTSLGKSVVLVVEREVGRRRREGELHSDLEKELLERLGKEAGQWAEQAELLMTEVLKESKERARLEPDGSASEVMSEVETSRGEHSLPQEMFVMGRDLNLHSKSLMEIVNKIPQPEPPSLADLGLLSQSEMPEGSGYLPEDTETLARQLNKALADLEEQKKLTEQEQNRAQEAEKQVQSTAARLTSLEAQLQLTQRDLEELREQQTQTKMTSRGGKAGGGRRGKGGGGRPSSRK